MFAAASFLTVALMLQPAAAQERTLTALVEDATLVSWPVLEELARDFEARHAGVRVELLSLGGASGTQDKVKFMLAGDLPLDLIRIDVTEAAAFLAEEALLDLQPHFDADVGWDPSSIFSAPLAACRDAEEHLFGLPQTFTPYVMYVNRDLLARTGLAAPGADWTWEDFLALARAGTRDTDGDGRTDEFGISLTQWLQAVVPWVWQNGGELLDAGGTRSRMDEPGFAGALAFLRELLFEERVASFDATFAGQLSQGLFQAGRALFYGPVGYWETYRFQHIDAFAWDVLPLPRGERAATSVAMGIYVVPRTAREPELAYAFLREVLCGMRYQQLMAEIGNGVPGLVAAARSESFLANPAAPPSVEVFLDVMDDARFMPPLANWRKIESLCQAELEGVLLTGATSAAAGARAMAAKTDAFLGRERARHGRRRLPSGAMALALSVSLLALGAVFLARRGPAPPAARAREERHAYGMITLWALGFVAFLFGPAVVSLVLSLCEWSPLRPFGDMGFVGGANYARLASDPTFHASLSATAAYAALAVPAGLVVALALALLLRSPSTLAGIVRTACYVPAILSPVIVAAVWRFVFDADDGLINRQLRAFGAAGVAWLREPNAVVPAFALMAVWGIGAQMLVFLAALQAIDPALEEAARVDGAGPWRRFWHVILPALTPVVLFNLVTGTIAAFQVFAQPYVMTQGGPGDASRFLVLYLYESGFRHLDMGYASAIAWVLFVILGVLSLTLLASARHWVHYAGRARG
ncbi:MAG: extracellular solute-binding protein [bacterium]|nr:extracellular solute-binding protein [bacterium]